MADCVKYGLQIPNRVFVGGLAFDTKEEELKEFFSQYGKVKDCKIVTDKDGSSRGFGFVTFESKQEAVQTQKLGTVFYKQKKLNLGPAIRQKGVVFNSSQDQPSEPVPSSGMYIHANGYAFTVAPNGMWYFHSNSDEPLTGQSTSQEPPTPPPVPAAARSPPPVSVSVYATESIPGPFPLPSQYITTAPNMNILSAPQPSNDIPVGFVPNDGVTPFVHWYPHGTSTMSQFPLASPPPVPNHQAHPVHHPAYFVPVSTPRPEIFHLVTTPVDPAVLEGGPIIPYDSLVRPTPLRPAVPIKRVTARLPQNGKKFPDARSVPNGVVPGLVGHGKVLGVVEK